jgi:hypothetical protein
MFTFPEGFDVTALYASFLSAASPFMVVAALFTVFTVIKRALNKV